MRSEKATDRMLELMNDKGKRTGSQLVFDQLKMDVRPSLVEYLGQGWQMEVSIAIDFTLSNYELTDYRSLHAMKARRGPNEMN